MYDLMLARFHRPAGLGFATQTSVVLTMGPPRRTGMVADQLMRPSSPSCVRIVGMRLDQK